MTPYGNITTDPRLIHLTGEKLIFSCHSGEKDENGTTVADKDKEVIIISNSKESVDPRSELETESPEEEKNFNDIKGCFTLILQNSFTYLSTLEFKGREKRSTDAHTLPAAAGLQKKDCTCNCAC